MQPAPAPRHVVVPADWTYEGKVVEVKSKNDSLWAEQRMWIRACTEPDYDIGYENPYLFEDDGEGGRIGTVDISTTKVAEKGGRKKGVAGGQKPSNHPVLRFRGRCPARARRGKPEPAFSV